MARFKQPAFGFSGLNTKSTATGLPVLDLVHLQDMRVVGRDLVERLGIVRVGKVAGDLSAADFDSGSSEYASCTVDTSVWSLGKYWTLEMLVEPDSVTGEQNILSFGHASTWPVRVFLNGTDIDAQITDSGDTVTTLDSSDGGISASINTKYGIQVVRSGTSITLRVNGAEADTGTMADLACKAPATDLLIGKKSTGSHFDGTVDYVRLFSYAKTHHNDWMLRHPAPRAPYVLADYDFNESSGGLFYDRSRYENHLIAQATPTAATTLAHNPAPVRALSMGVDQNNRKQLLVCAGGKYYLAAGD